MRKISANYIYPISQPPIKNGIIVVDDNSKIIDLIDTKGKVVEIAGLEFYNGVLVPGFVNTYCQLEHSYFRHIKFPFNSADDFFLKQNKISFPSTAKILKAIENADYEMDKKGIVAVADISVTKNSLSAKKKSSLFYRNLIKNCEIESLFKNNKLSTAIFSENITILSSGFFKWINSPFCSEAANNNYYSFCPNSNYFIEKKHPKSSILKSSQNIITLGTGSLASNKELSILEEIKLTQFQLSIPFEKALGWATINGAELLGYSEILGSFDVGKIPGINLIQQFDFTKMQLNNNCSIKKIL